MLLIYSTFKSNRLDYIFDQVLTDFMGLDWRLTQDVEEFTSFTGPKFNYSEKRLGDEFWFQSYGLLNQNGLNEPQPDCFLWKGLPVFFKVDDSSDFPFDLFSLIFYLITRYEEYSPGVQFDLHGRYFAQQSTAYRNRFLEIPLVDILVAQFKHLLQAKYPKLDFKKHRFQYLPTFDMDVLFAHKAKPLWRLLGGSIRDLLRLNFKEIRTRIDVLSGKIKDPFIIFDELLAIVNDVCERPLVFVNLGRYGAFDKNNSVSNPEVSAFLISMSADFKMAIHPSYRSNDKKSELDSEVLKFKNLYGELPLQSRQHFLRLSFPHTYQDLISVGITEDYSMGYTTHIGFRASTSFPYYFYNLSKEEKTDLKIYSCAFMDATLFDTMKLTPEQALDLIRNMAKLIQKLDGILIGIWHNSYIADDKIKMQFFKDIAEKLNPNQS